MTDRTDPAPAFDVSIDASLATEELWLAGVRKAIMRSRPDASDDEFAAAFARQLVTRTADGISLQPLYTAADAPPELPAPGEAPYVRGRSARPAPWEIRQRVWANVEGSSAVAELESGATGVLLELGSNPTAADLTAALDGVLLELAPVSLATPPDDDGSAAATLLLDRWDADGVTTPAGSLGVDPIGAWLRSGGGPQIDASFDAAAHLVARCADLPVGVRTLVVDATVFHDAGATAVEELGWGIAAAVTTLRALEQRGVSDAGAAQRVEFRWSADDDQFATIGKLRAARLVWARVAELGGFAPDGATHHVEGSRAMMSAYDLWVNSLRSTVACFAAAVGGADAITIWPHDAVMSRGGSLLGRRIARNTQTIIESESHMARVVDPAGGSFYVEQLTAEMAEAAWSALAAVEAGGGLLAAVRAGTIHAAVAASLEARQRAVARRTRPLTGMSEFPNFAEQLLDDVAGFDQAPTGGHEFAAFTLARWSADFEALRQHADRHAAATGARRTVALATLGPASAHTARVAFAQNLFASVGIATTVADITDITGLAADDSAGATVCLCASDADYAEHGAAAAASLRAAGATYVLLAGRAEIAGVDTQIYAGCDVVAAATGLREGSDPSRTGTSEGGRL